MDNTESTLLEINLFAIYDSAAWAWHSNYAEEATEGSRNPSLDLVSNYPTRHTESEELKMSKVRMKKTTDGNVAGAISCMDPANGYDQVIAYIVGDLSEDSEREFKAHLGDCKACLESVVLWRMSEALVDAEDQTVAAAETAEG